VRLSWFGEFVEAFPAAMRALWEFGDPMGRGDGWWGIVILLIWGIFLTAIPLYVAKITYGKREWVSATMGVIAGLSIFWWVYGIFPSAWIFFLDANKEILSGPIIPDSMRIPMGWAPWARTVTTPWMIATNLYEVIREEDDVGKTDKGEHPLMFDDYVVQQVDRAVAAGAGQAQAPHRAHPELCILCRACEDVCPWECIYMMSPDIIKDADNPSLMTLASSPTPCSSSTTTSAPAAPSAWSAARPTPCGSDASTTTEQRRVRPPSPTTDT
jgi:NAD-dependent dihydropyrimidine dehydrogenase PreA subunit